MDRILVNDGFMPLRDEIDTLSVLLDMRALPLNHSTSTFTSLSTALLSVMLQKSINLVPAYKIPPGVVTATLGFETARYGRYSHTILTQPGTYIIVS